MLDRMACWKQLAANAFESNAFHDPAFISAAALHIPDGPAPRFLVIERMIAGEVIWIGALPLTHSPLDAGLPMLRSWRNRQVALGTPLLHAAYAEDAIASMLDWLADSSAARGLLFSQLCLDGPVAGLLRAAIARKGLAHQIFGQHERAKLELGLGGDAYGREHWRPKKLKELRRLRNRLAEHGPLTFAEAAPESVSAAMETFLLLEAQGWKGERGTALVQEPGRAAFARTALRSLSCQGRLSIYTLSAGDEIVATGLVLRQLDRAYFWKLAINERLASLSPGVLFLQSLTEALLERNDISSADSCAIANHPMIDHFWKERMPIGDLLVGARPGNLAFRLMCWRERASRNLRATAKNIWHAGRGNKR